MTAPVAFIAPTFWGPPEDKFYEDTDQIYDHPIPVDREGCLGRFLQSLECLEGDFDVVLSSASSSTSWEAEVDEKIAEVIEASAGDYNCWHFTYESAEKLRQYLRENGAEELLEPVSMYGYSEVRNMSVLAAHIAGYDTIISTDDDVVVDDPGYVNKAQEFIGETVPETGEQARVVCGPYYTEEGTVTYAESPPDWMAYWNNAEAMNEAFNRYIFGEPRLKETSYVVMGNIVLHRDFFSRVPLDPNCHRGEDMDWLINARMFGHRFYMDRDLRVQHQPPPRGFPLWKLVRLDIERFIYDREKVNRMEEKLGIPASYFEPWPGEFLKPDLEERIFKTNMMLSQEFMVEDDREAVRGCMENIFYAEHEYDPGDPLREFQEFQSSWEQLMDFVDENREEIKRKVF